MYDVTLINLNAEAQSAAVDAERIELRAIPPERLRELLRNFAALDAVENATADPELRVQTRGQSFLVHHTLGKLSLQDVLNRDVATGLMTPDEVMAEIDGSAGAARALRAQTAAPWTIPLEEPALPAPAPIPWARRLVLTGVALLLLAGIAGLRLARADDRTPAGFVAADDVETLARSLAGVYLTGTQPGDHGISIFNTGEVRIFQFRAGDAPGLIYAEVKLGHFGEVVCLATDQPGGLITVPDAASLIYCGETYRRVP